jgi:hypothetical protein
MLGQSSRRSFIGVWGNSAGHASFESSSENLSRTLRCSRHAFRAGRTISRISKGTAKVKPKPTFEKTPLLVTSKIFVNKTVMNQGLANTELARFFSSNIIAWRDSGSF